MAKEYIEKEAILSKLPQRCFEDDYWSLGFNMCADICKALVRETPTADAVKVVRCKDCFIPTTSGQVAQS